MRVGHPQATIRCGVSLPAYPEGIRQPRGSSSLPSPSYTPQRTQQCHLHPGVSQLAEAIGRGPGCLHPVHTQAACVPSATHRQARSKSLAGCTKYWHSQRSRAAGPSEGLLLACHLQGRACLRAARAMLFALVWPAAGSDKCKSHQQPLVNLLVNHLLESREIAKQID